MHVRARLIARKGGSGGKRENKIQPANKRKRVVGVIELDEAKILRGVRRSWTRNPVTKVKVSEKKKLPS